MLKAAAASALLPLPLRYFHANPLMGFCISHAFASLLILSVHKLIPPVFVSLELNYKYDDQYLSYLICSCSQLYINQPKVEI